MPRSSLLLIVTACLFATGLRPVLGQFSLVRDGEVAAEIAVDVTGCQGKGAETLQDAAAWLRDSLAAGSRVPAAAEILTLPVGAAGGRTNERPRILIARADAYRAIAADAGLKPDGYDNYCIVSRADRLFLLGNSEAAAQHAVAGLLRHLGFRWYAPSPQWHHVPRLVDVTVDLQRAEAPQLIHRGIWYAYAGGDRQLMDQYRRWAIANRLSVQSILRTGHSYGNIINRNQEAFAAHPEYYALLPDGSRDATRAVNARKFCFSNPGLIELVAADRAKLLAEYRRVNPAAFMVSVDPSDGEGTCHCDDCKALGTSTDRVLHLANEVARRLRAEDPRAWVGLYAYSSHRLPPTIDVEPNVYVQVAMGFNRTQYTLPQLVSLWSKKVGAIGLREYYGVEAWDWGLPGKLRGGQVDYHRRWIPYYAKRKLNAINAETNANWGAQTLGLYVASALMWNPATEVDPLIDEFFTDCFQEASDDIRQLYEKFAAAPPLRPATLLPMFDDVQRAWDRLDRQPPSPHRQAVRGRLVDLMAYLVYVAKFREFDLVRSRSAERGDPYYDALQPLMNYTYRIRLRDVVHHYALARRLCNGLPVQDNRLDFYMFNKDAPPIWQQGEPLTDEEIIVTFRQYRQRLQSDGSPLVTFSRYLDPVRVDGADAGPSRVLNHPVPSTMKFRGELRSYLVPAGKQTVRFEILPSLRSTRVTVYLRENEILFERTYLASDGKQEVTFQLPKANEYRMDFLGDAELTISESVPFVYEASLHHPAWIDYSGPHYFLVPSGTRQLIADANPRLTVIVPGPGRQDLTPARRIPGKDYIVLDVPESAAGQVWHTSPQTRGKFSLLNVPPLLSLHRKTLMVPREIPQ